MVEVTDKDYRDLCYYRCMQQAGVDNWEDGGITWELFQDQYPQFAEEMD